MVESTGVGSIWNKNSWHWEERNYTELAKKWLGENLIKIAVMCENSSMQANAAAETTATDKRAWRQR